MHWYAGLEAICRTDVPLHHYTWYHLGGPARWFVGPRDAADLGIILERCRTHGISWRILGRGWARVDVAVKASTRGARRESARVN